MKYEVRELSLGEVFDEAIKVLKDNFGLFFGIIACLQLPLSIVSGIIMSISTPEIGFGATLEEYEQYQADSVAALPIIYGLAAISFVLTPISQGAIIHGISKVYLGQSVTMGECFRRSFQRYFPFLLTNLLFYVCIYVGACLCLFPSILFALWFGLFAPIVVIESISGPDALNRSKLLIKGNLLSFFVFGILILAVALVVGFGTNFIPNVYVMAILSQVMNNVSVLFGVTATVIFYYSCRSKVENFDLYFLAGAFQGERTNSQPIPQATSYVPNNPYANPNNPYQQKSNYDQGNPFQQPSDPNPPSSDPPTP